MKPAGGRAIARRLLAWYHRHGRDLPWRRRPDPYRVWVSEIMLQQTTVTTAGPYFERFIRAYPDVSSLARAREEDVLALWSGLGYYHRARNLLASARLIVQRHRGHVPEDLAALRDLPGIGAYTAGAIRSIGHGRPSVALDANITRVMARLGGVTGDVARAKARRAIASLAETMIPHDAAADFNQALMDLGAMVCMPRNPRCEVCPIRSDCVAFATGMVDRIPMARPRARSESIELVAVAVLRRRARASECLLVERSGGSLMRGLWEIPLAASGGARAAEALARRLGARVRGSLGCFRHTITRHRMTINVYEATPSPARRRRSGASARAVSEPAARLATPWNGPEGPRRRWEPLGRLESSPSPVPLTATARKVLRLLGGDRRLEGEGGPAW